MTEIRGVDSLTFGGKLPPCHGESHLELLRYQLGCYWNELAENVKSMDVPRKVIGIEISFLVIKISVAFN